jgi:hypothetical protein
MLLVVAGLLTLDACGSRTNTRGASSGASSSGGAAAPAEPQTPAQMDERYRERARHLTRNPVWESPLRSLNNDALAALRQYSQSRGNPETYLTLEVVSADWSVMRHNLTGIVTGRSVGAVVIARFPDGRCLQYGTSMRQEYVGGDFASAMTTNGTGGGVPLPCEAVDAITAARPDTAR